MTEDELLLRDLARDEAYATVRPLADGPLGLTELVTHVGDPSAPLVRKRIPAEIANADAWRAASLAHCALLPSVRELIELPDQLVVIYDYLDGPTLAEYVSARGALPESEALALLRDMCEAAGALHEAGVVHRDISPKNVVVREGRAHLIDLGISRVWVPGATHDTTRLGTWGYAAPEQYGFAQTDGRSDIFSSAGSWPSWQRASRRATRGSRPPPRRSRASSRPWSSGRVPSSRARDSRRWLSWRGRCRCRVVTPPPSRTMRRAILLDPRQRCVMRGPVAGRRASRSLPSGCPWRSCRRFSSGARGGFLTVGEAYGGEEALLCLGLVVSVLAVAIELTAALAREERYAGRAGRARILLVRILLCAAAWFALFLLLCVEAAIRGALLA